MVLKGKNENNTYSHRKNAMYIVYSNYIGVNIIKNQWNPLIPLIRDSKGGFIDK
jgi:hypothetical protein